MLDIWKPQSQPDVIQFCALHEQLSGESLDGDLIGLWQAEICPYPGYTLHRLLLQPQVITRKQGAPVKLESSHVAYVLQKVSPGSDDHRLIPLQMGVEEIYITNELLNLKVTESNATDYGIFYGLVASSDPRFTFFSKLSHIKGILTQQLKAPDALEAKIKVQAIFSTTNGDSLELGVQSHKHFLLGEYVTLRLPTIFGGRVYSTKMRFTEAGLARMDSDEELSIEGIVDPEALIPYCPLDKSDGLYKLYSRTEKRLGFKTKMVTYTLLLDKITHIWLLPLFLFNFLLFLIFGAKDPAMHTYFERLQESYVLNAVAALLGLLGTLIAVFRYAFLEFAVYVRNIVPSSWEFIVVEIEKQSHLPRQRAVALLVFSFFELTILVWLALTLLVYGWTNILGASITNPALNFAEAMHYVVLHIPGVESLLGQSAAKVLGLASDSKAMSVLISTMFTTVILGLLGRQLKLIIAKQS